MTKIAMACQRSHGYEEEPTFRIAEHPERVSRSVSVRGERCRQTAEPLQQTRQGTRPPHSTNQQLLENFQLEGSHPTSCPFKKD